VLDLLPEPVDDVGQLGGPHRPWLVRYGGRAAVVRANDLEHLARLGFSADLAMSSIEWLHNFLRDLAGTGFTAPAPIAQLGGKSIALADGVIWELLTFVPGRPMGWRDDEIRRAGQLLARFHDASLRTRPRPQRPGALAIEECRPVDPRAASARRHVEVELAEIRGSAHGVVHGDATQANVVIDDDDYRLVDFALGFRDALVFDIASALWRNGRVDASAVVYDPHRVETFVRGYHETRGLRANDDRRIVAGMMARGLQLQHRLERRSGVDDTVMLRLLAIERQQSDLRAAIASAIS
jgi:Ser/Thr protein kinase RdoA (MazF antagonist)